MADQAESLRKAFEEFNAKKKKSTNIITIASGKGGVGKSILAVNMGLALADNGKKVTVMDADFGLANINVILGVLPKYTLYHVFKGNKKLDEILIEVDDNFYIIAGASGFYQLANLNSKQRNKILNQLESLNNNDYLIIDVGAGISNNVLNMIVSSQQTIIVTTPEPTAITDAYGIIKSIVSVNKNDIKLNLVVNRVRSIIEAKQVSNRIMSIVKQFLDVDINYLGFIFDDPVVYKSVKEQEPFIRNYPKSKASSCILNLVNSITNGNIGIKEKSIKNFLKNFFKISQK